MSVCLIQNKSPKALLKIKTNRQKQETHMLKMGAWDKNKIIKAYIIKLPRINYKKLMEMDSFKMVKTSSDYGGLVLQI